MRQKLTSLLSALVVLTQFLIISTPAHATLPPPPVNLVRVYEGDGVNQTGGKIHFARGFKDGEILNCPVPVASVGTGTYQVDKVHRWPSSYVSVAEITYTPSTFVADSVHNVTFVNGTCNNTGFLSQAQMLAYAGGTWDFQIEVIPQGGSTPPVCDLTHGCFSARAMLTALTFGDQKLRYLKQGSLETQVEIQDGASTSFCAGWHNTGGQMLGSNGVAAGPPFTGASSLASLCPKFILTFDNGGSHIEGELILRNSVAQRQQDQSIKVTMRSTTSGESWDSTDAVGNVGGLWNMIGNTTAISVLHYGTRPGMYYLDPGLDYLSYAKLLPTFALTEIGSHLSSSTAGDGNNGTTSYNQWASGGKCKPGDGACINAMDKAFSQNSEGTPISREVLGWLVSAKQNTCGTVNGECRKWYAMLTGMTDHHAGNVLTGCLARCGLWYAPQNIPFHNRWQGSGNFYYSSYDPLVNPTGTRNTAATGGSGATSANGRNMSQMQGLHQYLAYGAGTQVGDQTINGWFTDLLHWQDYSFHCGLFTLDQFCIDEEMEGAGFVSMAVNPDFGVSGYSWGYFNSLYGGTATRQMGWGTLTEANAAFLADGSDSYGLPCGSLEKCVFTSYVQSNIAVHVGLKHVTTDPHVPVGRACGIITDISTYTREELGRCGTGRNNFIPLHGMYEDGGCIACENYLSATQIHAITSATFPVMTVDRTFGPCGGVAFGNTYIYGLTGVWAPLNGYHENVSRIDETHVQVNDFSTAAIAQPMTASTAMMSSLLTDTLRTNKAGENWMDAGATIALNIQRRLGFSDWHFITDDINLRGVEMLTDVSFNPYLFGLYEMPSTIGVAADWVDYTCSAPAQSNPTKPTTWAQVIDAIIPPLKTIAVFQGECGGDHTYGLMSRAAVTFAVNDGLPNSTVALRWLDGDGGINLRHFPLLFEPVPGSPGTAACNNDLSVKYALAPDVLYDGGGGTTPNGKSGKWTGKL